MIPAPLIIGGPLLPVVTVGPLPGPEVANPTLLVGSKPNGTSRYRVPSKADVQLARAEFNNYEVLVGAQTGWGAKTRCNATQRR